MDKILNIIPNKLVHLLKNNIQHCLIINLNLLPLENIKKMHIMWNLLNRLKKNIELGFVLMEDNSQEGIILSKDFSVKILK
jgi:hypothetical protein